MYHLFIVQADNAQAADAKTKIDQIVEDIKKKADEGTGSGSKEKYVIPPHLHDLQEAELPEAQRGLVISEIALFRERAAKREREKLRDEQERGRALGISSPYGGKGSPASGSNKAPVNAPSGPKGRGVGSGQQGYGKAPAFVQSQSQSQSRTSQAEAEKTDEQKEQDRKDARMRDENESFRDVSGISSSSVSLTPFMFFLTSFTARKTV